MAKDRRVEVLFEQQQYKRLEEAAHREGKSVGAMVREAVAKYVVSPTGAEREAALQRLLSIDTGIDPGSPEELKRDLVRDMDEYLEKKLNVEAD